MSTLKRTVFVGGFGEGIDEKALTEEFCIFGKIVGVSIPLEWATGEHRGFGFVEFEEPEDAAAAIDNMNYTELRNHVVHVAIARPIRVTERSERPVWADDDWLKRYTIGKGNKRSQQQGQKEGSAENEKEDDMQEESG